MVQIACFTLFIYLFLLCQLNSSCFAYPYPICHPEESFALLQFKQMFTITESITDGCDNYQQASIPKTKSWKKSVDCCRWDGVKCDRRTGHVIALELSCSQLLLADNLNLSISSLFQLSHLQNLNLASNDFNGSPIPREFGWLTTLTHLNLSYSNLHGQIPSEISQLSHLVSLDISSPYGDLQLGDDGFKSLIANMSHLQVLSLSSVNISFELPMNLSSSFTYLDLSWTGVHGKLPDYIFNLPKLQTLSLAKNPSLAGRLPQVNSSTTLKHLDLGGNNISGELPHSIGYLKYLNYLDLSDCNIMGSIPESIGNLTEINSLDLTNNNFTGQFPSTITNLTQITNLYLSANSLTGPLPNHAHGLQKLEVFDIAINLVNGTIPSWLFSLPSLTELYLLANFFTGRTSDFKSKSLQVIDLTVNQLHGLIPSGLFSLPSLTLLYLTKNHFTGRMSEFKSKSLQQIDLSDNQLNGPIPQSISTLVNLTWFDVSWNNLSGRVQLHMFAGCNQLQILSLSHNHLSFVISNNTNISFPNLLDLRLSSCGLVELPKFLRHSENLEFLDLSNNNIQDQVPTWLTPKRLDSLNLSHNLLTGLDQLPWKGLTYLDLQSNLFEGQLSEAVCDFDRLKILSLSNNNFSGQLPQCLGNLSMLDVLNLSNNNFTGEIPQCLGNLSRLYVLNLSNNNLAGEIPQCLGNLSGLYVLNLSNNNFTGEIPQRLGNLSNLFVLDLQRNRFHGMIPPFSERNRLRIIVLNGNKLEGFLSQSLANCKALEVLDVGHNNIDDTFPWWLESLPELQVLVLKFNKFHGFITSKTLKNERSFPKLRIIDVSVNQFSGLLPAELLKHFDAMKEVDEEKIGLNYVGLIKSSLGEYYNASVSVIIKGVEFKLVKILTIFTTIDLSCNNFYGQIPESIGYLHSLHLLNLSHNNLDGEIPSVLGNLSNLDSLDLSCNQLQGEIPMALTKLTFLAVLNLSQNHLVGRIPRSTQFDTFGNNSYGGNLGLCGFPLSKDCGNGGATEPTTPPVSEEENESEFLNVFYLSAILMGCGCGLVIGLATGFLVFSYRKPNWLFGILDAPIRRLERQRRRVRWRYISIAH